MACVALADRVGEGEVIVRNEDGMFRIINEDCDIGGGEELSETAGFSPLEDGRLLLESAGVGDVVQHTAITADGGAALGLGLLCAGCGEAKVLQAAVGVAEHELTDYCLFGDEETRRAVALLEGIGEDFRPFGEEVLAHETNVLGRGVDFGNTVRSTTIVVESICACRTVWGTIVHRVVEGIGGVPPGRSEAGEVR